MYSKKEFFRFNYLTSYVYNILANNSIVLYTREIYFSSKNSFCARGCGVIGEEKKKDDYVIAVSSLETTGLAYFNFKIHLNNKIRYVHISV